MARRQRITKEYQSEALNDAQKALQDLMEALPRSRAELLINLIQRICENQKEGYLVEMDQKLGGLTESQVVRLAAAVHCVNTTAYALRQAMRLPDDGSGLNDASD